MEQQRLAPTRIGIAFSGGGIRSAAFSLGVYQRLEESGVFRRARFLAGVSGGAYLAAGLAIGHARATSADSRPWSRLSPEEHYLSRHLSYLAPDGRGRVWLLANLAYGLALNLLPLFIAAVLVGRILGLVYAIVFPGLADGAVATAPVLVLAVLSCLLVMFAIGAVGLRRFRDTSRFGMERLAASRLERLVMYASSCAGAIFVLGVALPLLISLISTVLPPARSSVGSLWFQRVGIAAACSLVFAALGGLAVSLLSRHVLRRTRGVLAAVSGPGILIAPLVLSAQSKSAIGWQGLNDVVVLLVLLVALAMFGVVAHNRRYSMHLFYRERLQEAFCLVRHSDAAVSPVPHDQPVFLSTVGAQLKRLRERGLSFPELIVCAAVAARGHRAPHKERAVSFAFTGDISGNDDAGVRIETARLERDRWLGGGSLTLPAMMAISGAALSPLMGRFTLPAFRFLMAVLNIRLGVWIRNPNPSSRDRFANIDRWADRTAQRFGIRALAANAWLGWREPGPWFVLKEGLGLANITDRYLYVSDGGHWENLGLVELLRRQCTHIICVDASSNPVADLARASAIARRDLGAEVTLRYERLERSDDGSVADPVAVGTVRYRDGSEGQITVGRCALWGGAPGDLRILGSSGSPFPHHPTSKQFLSGEDFEAYRALGWAIGGRIVEVSTLPPEAFDERVSSPDEPLARPPRLVR